MAAGLGAGLRSGLRPTVPWRLGQCRGLRQRRPPLAAALTPPCSKSFQHSVLRQSPSRHAALITLSGHTRVSSGNDVWNGIAQVMKEVGGNIEDAAGTSMQSDAFSAGGLHTERRKERSPRFMVSAFNTRIAPFSLAPWQVDHRQQASLMGMRSVFESEDSSSSDEVAVAFVVKASVDEDSVSDMSDLFHTRFPGLVCTVTVGAALDMQAPERKEASACSSSLPRQELTGTIRLFGKDQVGQLAGIAEVLHRCNVTILNLLVTTGVCDPETCEFLECVGGPLSENVVTVAALDRSTFDEEVLRKEVHRSATDVGYHVTSIILDNEKLRSQHLASYYLRRKVFLGEGLFRARPG